MCVIFEDKLDDFFKEFKAGRKMVLSTSYDDYVTSRMMSIIQKDGNFYFQTDKTFRKYNQLIHNKHVALCIDNIQIEGICKELGHPMENLEFAELYKENFPNSFHNYTSLPNERLFCITPTYIERWIYIHKMPFLETFHFEKQEYRLQKYQLD